jgi:rhodanese-related sulfurtransferase
MTRAELQKLSDTARPTILDIGDRDAFRRGHQEGAVNIPVEELDLRARRELPLSGSIVIDCTQEQLFRCRAALAILRELGASKLALLVP